MYLFTLSFSQANSNEYTCISLWSHTAYPRPLFLRIELFIQRLHSSFFVDRTPVSSAGSPRLQLYPFTRRTKGEENLEISPSAP